ncbi:MAG: aminotransferase class I/II-fold pyridoxal phosphate-dependent enzyme [Gammaproteobacteria bacterium]|nr:aminotransferase class I/II-fold pyridoxal phosphate-dependent enzyme [Gammaproteobacteria bacterium]
MTTPLQELSPLRNTTSASDAASLAREQLLHFAIDPDSDYGKTLGSLATMLYTANVAAHDLWRITVESLKDLDRSDRIAYFNAKRFLCFQLAKILDSLQNPLRSTYQSITTQNGGFSCKGPFPLFDNVTAIFSATPVIARTATYLYACTEWVADAFTGREPLLEIYSRLLNPTSISLANHIVDVECGARANEYMAWNFNSGMAAIDALMAHLLGANDIVLSSRNIYGGTYQLLHDWYGKNSNLGVAIEWVDGFDGPTFEAALNATEKKYADRIKAGSHIYVYVESPCNPHGNVLDVPAISKLVHAHGWMLICDSTIGTPMLHPVLKRDDPAERPDFVTHSYTKDLAGTGTTTAGVVIGRNERMFMPKGDSVEIVGFNGKPETIRWDETLFWNVYYVKGAFLDADKAFEVLHGIKTFEIRMLQKAVNTLTLARILAAHPDINVHCPAVAGNPNQKIMQKVMHLGLPAPLFTIDLGGDNRTPISRAAFKRFFDSLEPSISLQVSLGQTNTTALCPALTSHSEMAEDALRAAGIRTTTIRISVGLEDPRMTIVHLQRAAKLALDVEHPEFSSAFLPPEKIDQIYRETYIEVHSRFVGSLPSYQQLAG